MNGAPKKHYKHDIKLWKYRDVDWTIQDGNNAAHTVLIEEVEKGEAKHHEKLLKRKTIVTAGQKAQRPWRGNRDCRKEGTSAVEGMAQKEA